RPLGAAPTSTKYGLSSRSWGQSIGSQPTTTNTPRDAPAPIERHAHGLQGKTCWSCSLLHSLKKCSLLKTRGDSTFGNIVTFRDLEQATIDAITLFGDKNTRNVVLEKSYKEYMEGFTDAATGEARRGFMDVVRELEARFPDPADIVKEADKKAFVKLFGEYLRVENVLQNYDEFASLKALQSVD